MMSRIRNLFLFVFILSPNFALAEGTQVVATVDRNQVGMGDVINLTIAVSSENSTNVNPPNLPALDGFDLINSSSGMETRSTFINGKFMTEQSRNFNYMLAITKKGVLSIPAIAVAVDGKTYKTQEIKISATSARATPPPQAGRQAPDPLDQMDEMEDLFNQMLQRRMQPRGAPGANPRGAPPSAQAQNIPSVNPEEAFFIHVETDKQKVVVGEQITASFYIYTRGNIRDIDTLKYPDLKGFWKEEIEMATRLNFEQVVVNGIPYQRALLVSYALFPIHAGKATVDPYKAKCTVITPSNFGFGRPYVFTKASPAVAIEVTDVPTSGKPTSYSGAVGSFRLSAAFEPPTGTVNQPVTLRVRFEGQGNAKLIELPKLDLPPTFELYDQKSQAKFLKDGTSFKEFEVLIIPREPGVFKIPAVSTAVFDPRTQKYTALSSQSLSLAVTGSAGAAAVAQLGNTPAKAAESAPAQDVLPGLASDLDSGQWSSNFELWVTLGLYLLVFGFLAQQAWAKLKVKPRRASLKIVVKVRLKRIRALSTQGEWRRVGVELTNAIYYVLGQLAETGGASEELMRLLEHTPPSLRQELSEPLQKLISQCEALSFAPEAMIGNLNQKPKLDELIAEFEKVMNRAIELAEI